MKVVKLFHYINYQWTLSGGGGSGGERSVI